MTKRTLLLPYAAEKGSTQVRSFQRQQKSFLFKTMMADIVFAWTKLLILFQQERRNLNLNLNLNLICETLWTGVRSGLLISTLGKLSWFHLTGPITMVLLM